MTRSGAFDTAGETTSALRTPENSQIKQQDPQRTYLTWLIGDTETKIWHDSADPHELDRGLERGIVGVTTNPVLANIALSRNRALWKREIDEVLVHALDPEKKAEELLSIPIKNAATKLRAVYQRSGGAMGYVCAQVNPSRAGDRDAMLAMARRFAAWAPNIAVKLPATAAGLDVLEECVANGITITSTVNFTVPQLLAVGERCSAAIQRARNTSIVPGRCFAVVMLGRIDDYLREVACDSRADVSEDDICHAGIAIAKRGYEIFRDRGYEAVLLLAAHRGSYHLTEFAGADCVASLVPRFQQEFEETELSFEKRIEAAIPTNVIERLRRVPDFVQAYEPDGMKPNEFITYGVCQRTLSQFIEAGWKLLESFQ
jgi:transaldolase